MQPIHQVFGPCHDLMPCRLIIALMSAGAADRLRLRPVTMDRPVVKRLSTNRARTRALGISNRIDCYCWMARSAVSGFE